MTLYNFAKMLRELVEGHPDVTAVSGDLSQWFKAIWFRTALSDGPSFVITASETLDLDWLQIGNISRARVGECHLTVWERNGKFGWSVLPGSLQDCPKRAEGTARSQIEARSVAESVARVFG